MRLSTQSVRLQAFFAALIMVPLFAQAASAAVSGQTDAASLVAHAFQIPSVVPEELFGAMSDLIGRLRIFAPGPILIALLLVPVFAVALLKGLVAAYRCRLCHTSSR